MDIHSLLKIAIQREASDLHITTGAPPILRIDGELQLTEHRELTSRDTRHLCYSLMNGRQQALFEENLSINFSYSVNGIGRCRVNIHHQRGNVEAAIRLVHAKIRTIDELKLPKIAKELARKRDGLVLVTGPAGVGKTTTLAAMVDLINSERRSMVLVIEDPIEYVHENKLSIIKQIEVSLDALSFNEALRQALRQDPNVIVVGEMRDLETISTALTAAETGHLVIATLHTPATSATIDRIIDVFPAYQQEQIRVQLAAALEGVIAQQLLPRTKGGRIVATEVLIGTTAVKTNIRERQTHQLPSFLEVSRGLGMHTMDRSLAELCLSGEIAYDIALARARFPEMVEKYLSVGGGE